MGRTSIVCGIYNQILNCAGDKDVRGMKLSGIIIASSLLMLSINMGEVLDSDKNLETSNEPQLYELGEKASAFLTNLLNSGDLEDLLTNYENSGDYTRFMSLIKNPTTGTYLEMARSVGQLFRQGGGSLPFENLLNPDLSEIRNQFSLKVAGTGTSQPTTPPNIRGIPLSMNPELHFH